MIAATEAIIADREQSSDSARWFRMDSHSLEEHRDGVTLEGVEFFRNYFVLFERSDGLQHMRVTDFRTDASHEITFPEPVYSAFNSTNRVFDTNVFRFQYQSFITPSSVFDYNLDTRDRTLMKRQEVLGGYNPEEYVSERILAKASDGVEIPISIVYRKGMKKDGYWKRKTLVSNTLFVLLNAE